MTNVDLDDDEEEGSRFEIGRIPVQKQRRFLCIPDTVAWTSGPWFLSRLYILLAFRAHLLGQVDSGFHHDEVFSLHSGHICLDKWNLVSIMTRCFPVGGV